MRSKLFVPGVRPERFVKALATGADALSLDLEDAVPAARKHEARGAVRGFLQGVALHPVPATIIVRVNALDSGHFDDDLEAVVRPGLDWINLPKVQHAEQVQQAATALERLELEHALASPVGLLLTIETPRALRLAHELAGAHPRVRGLQLGLGDLFEPLGIDRRNAHAAMFTLRMAAAEAGVMALDGAFPHIDDAAGFEHEARLARELGFAGKSCIHPSQVALAHAVFAPTSEEQDWARRVLAAALDAKRQGEAVFRFEGQMIDEPFLARARALLACAEATSRREGDG